MKLFRWLLRKGGDAPPQPTAPATPVSGSYLTDQPIEGVAEDRFNRWPFANRIAQTIIDSPPKRCTVIGIYGPWGDGKTSTLNLIEGALRGRENVVLVPFNPWIFGSEEQLLQAFFNELASKLDEKLPLTQRDISRELKAYGRKLSALSISLPFVKVDLDKLIGDDVSTRLKESRKTIDDLLVACGKRIVVLIDDIDRLDKTETHAIFKLVKLSGSFPNTTYLLAFDHEMVAAALGDKYGSGGVAAGRSFLEKIIQVPLHLPPPEEAAMRSLVFEEISEVLDRAGINLSDEDKATFFHRYTTAIEPRVRTPRQAKLYVNALSFAVPLLKDDTNAVDLMCVEALRIFYPKLYLYIRENPELFLGTSNERGSDRLNVIDKALAEPLVAMGLSDAKALRESVLKDIFPRVGSMGYGSEWEDIWALDKRVCARAYFSRYFQYAIPIGDVSDRDVDALIALMRPPPGAQQEVALRSFADKGNLPKLIEKLRLREDTLEPTVSATLARIIATNGSLVPRERGPWAFGGTFTQAAILVAHLVRRLGDDKLAAAHEVLSEGQPLPFAVECMRWMRKDKSQPEETRIFSVAQEHELEASLTQRIANDADKAPLYETYGREAPLLYSVWRLIAPDEVSSVLSAHLKAHPEQIDRFLSVFVGEAWSMETGIPVRSDFDRSNYDAVARLVDPELIFRTLKEKYGKEMDSPTYHNEREIPEERRIANQFAFVHAKAKDGDADDNETDSKPPAKKNPNAGPES